MLAAPRNVTRENVSTADEMYEAVEKNFEWCDALVMTAAVADYKVLNPRKEKIKKEEALRQNFELKLVENIDILKSLSDKKGEKGICRICT